MYVSLKCVHLYYFHVYFSLCSSILFPCISLIFSCISLSNVLIYIQMFSFIFAQLYKYRQIHLRERRRERLYLRKRACSKLLYICAKELYIFMYISLKCVDLYLCNFMCSSIFAYFQVYLSPMCSSIFKCVHLLFTCATWLVHMSSMSHSRNSYAWMTYPYIVWINMNDIFRGSHEFFEHEWYQISFMFKKLMWTPKDIIHVCETHVNPWRYYSYMSHSHESFTRSYVPLRDGGLGSRPKKMYGERLGDGVEYHLMSPTPRR